MSSSSSQQRKKSCSSSSVIIGSNHDLLSNILSLLPAQSLIKLQLVNKHWRSTISSNSFRRLHIMSTLRHPPPTFLLRLDDTADFFTFNPTTKKLLPFHFGHLRPRLYSHVEILQSCNGLLLLECFNVNDDYENNKYNYLVFNPTTMRSRNLRLSKPFLSLCLLFDPTKSPYYRVVCFLKCTGSAVLISVYDSANHKWNEEVELSNDSDKLSNEGVSGQQGIYWNDGVYFTRSKLFYNGSGKGKRVDDPYANDTYESVESNGRMHCVPVPLKDWLRVWELSKDGLFRWSEVCNVRLDWIMSSRRDDDDVSFLGLVRGEDDAMSTTVTLLLLLQKPGKIMVYDFGAADGTMMLSGFETVVDFSSESYCKRRRGVIQSRFVDAHQLVHTLVPV